MKRICITVNPKVEKIIEIFYKLQKNTIDTSFIVIEREKLISILQMDVFVKKIENRIFK